MQYRRWNGFDWLGNVVHKEISTDLPNPTPNGFRTLTVWDRDPTKALGLATEHVDLDAARLV
jgi:hypothetical protein